MPVTRLTRAILLYSKDCNFLLYSPHQSVANGAQPPTPIDMLRRTAKN